jgi:glycerol-3-phosphate dehydrogenase (NAD(P)+)
LKIGIIGSGGWGVALSCVLSANGHLPIVWSYEKETVEEINNKHTNSVYLPGIDLQDNIVATNSFSDLEVCDYLLISTPTQHIRGTISRASDLIRNKKIINVAKGVEVDTMLRVSEILSEVCAANVEDNYCVLTGPSHAEEVARKVATTVVGASDNSVLAKEVQGLFSNNYFRVYTSTDVIGCEIGGALKNVIAVAAGIIDGAGMGDNTKAALITRGLSEITRLAIAIGAQPMTMFGLSGIGDLFVTCASKLSRNRWVGEQIGKGRKFREVLAEMKMVAEGVHTTKSAFELSQKHQVEMPIVEQMYNILFKEVSPIDALNELMTRKSKKEWV